MARILVTLSLVLAAAQAHAFKFDEVFSLSDPKLEMLAWHVDAVTNLPGIGNCKGFLHRVRISELAADDNINVIFHEYLASLPPKGEEMDFAFIRYLSKDAQTVKATMRSMAPRDASEDLVAKVEQFSTFLTMVLEKGGQNLSYAGGVVHYVNPEKQESKKLVNIRMVQDVSRNEYLFWGNGQCAE